jgi:AcrR family transcriptional regulator
MGDKPTEEEILEAAGVVLGAEGYSGFTTQKVADEADVSQSLVHYYFETKEELVRALFEWGGENVEEAVADRVESDDPRERLLEWTDYMVMGGDEFEEVVEVNRVFLELRSLAVRDDWARDIIRGEREGLEAFVTDAVEDGIERGQFRNVDVESFAAIYASGIEATQNLTAMFADPDVVTAVYEGLVNLIDEYLVVENTA